MNTDQTFIGYWDVVEQHCRVRGEWVHEYDFAPGEWMIALFAEGRHSEIFRPEGMREEITSGGWTFDPDSGIISLHTDDMPRKIIRTAVFGIIETTAHLHVFADAPHVRPEGNSIITHHAHQRLRLMPISGGME